MNDHEPALEDPECRYILGQRVHATSYDDATARVLKWARAGESRTVCVTNVHMIMEGWDCPGFRACINNSDLVTPDGVPVVWGLRALGVPSATRVYGPDLTLYVCQRAAEEGIRIGLYGGTEESLSTFVEVLQSRFSGIQIACSISPPFRALSDEEETDYIREIQDSGAQLLFVGIGCPKQERWMAAHKGVLDLPMLGVGAAFDFHSGQVKQAPAWMQRMGLEWSYRLAMEPRRLWRRYAWHNPRFIVLFLWQLLRRRTGRSRLG